MVRRRSPKPKTVGFDSPHSCQKLIIETVIFYVIISIVKKLVLINDKIKDID